MNNCESSLYKCSGYLILLATLTLPAISDAEINNLQVVYSEGPGTEEIRAGNYDAAIEILESTAQDADNHYVADELATLCAMYIVVGRLSAASVTCQDAVETDGSDAAYNNRGVFRAHLGDAAGAMEDFARARILPDNQQRYIEDLMKGDARLISSSNYAVAKKYAARRRGNIGEKLVSRVRGASIEDLGN